MYLHCRKKLEEIRICFSSGMFVLLRWHRKFPSNENTSKSQSVNSAACGNLRKPRGCCVTHSFTFGFTTCCLQNATEESYRNKAIQACLLSCNSVQYFLQISLKSSHFFFLVKYQETCVCKNKIHKSPNKYWLIQKVFRSVYIMTEKIFQIILSSVKF